MKDENIVIGTMEFNNETGSINFLGIHPQYRKMDISKAFLFYVKNYINQLVLSTFEHIPRFL